MKISAVICTYKRADFLRTAVRSVVDQTLPHDEYEIIVVDNAGETEVKDLMDQFRSGQVNLRYVIEPEVGLSRARNRGLAEARGKYIAYLDDDARADAHWLENFVSTFELRDPTAIGGRVWLDWDGEKPAWVGDEQLALFTFVDHGDEGHVLRDREYLVGANMAFNVDSLKQVGGFDANLGRQGHVLLSGEEAKVLHALKERGQTVYYEPSAVVWHSVHPSRKRPSWLLRRMFWDGASQPLVNETQHSRRALFRLAMFDARQCVRGLLSALAATLRGRKDAAWQSLLGLSQRAGRVRTELRMLAN